MENTFKSIVNHILENGTKLDTFDPEPTSVVIGGLSKQRLSTHVYCVDKIPEGCVIEEINRLYFFNDRQGFFKANSGNIVNLATDLCSWDTGLSDSDLIKGSELNIDTIGNRICINDNGDIIVYKVIGFNLHNNGAKICFNVE